MDVLFITGMIFAIIITAIIANFALGEYNSALQNATSDTQVQEQLQNYTDEYAPNLDAGMALAFLAAHLSIILLGVFLPSHPALYPILFIALVVVVVLSAFVANAYEDFTASPEFVDSVEDFPMADWFMTHFVLVNLVMGFLDIVLFLVFKGDTGGGL